MAVLADPSQLRCILVVRRYRFILFSLVSPIVGPLRWRFPRGSSEVVSPLLQRTRHVDENRDLATFCQPHRYLKHAFIGFNRDDKGRWICTAFDKINLVSATRLSLIFTYGYPPPPPSPSSPNPFPHRYHRQSKNDHSSCGRTA